MQSTYYLFYHTWYSDTHRFSVLLAVGATHHDDHWLLAIVVSTEVRSVRIARWRLFTAQKSWDFSCSGRGGEDGVDCCSQVRSGWLWWFGWKILSWRSNSGFENSMTTRMTADDWPQMTMGQGGDISDSMVMMGKVNEWVYDGDIRKVASTAVVYRASVRS